MLHSERFQSVFWIETCSKSDDSETISNRDIMFLGYVRLERRNGETSAVKSAYESLKLHACVVPGENQY